MTVIADKFRRAELAKIHIAKKELALDDETYRAMLWTLARVRTSAELDSHGRRVVLEHLRSRGFVGAKRGNYPGRPNNTDSNAQVKKVEALLADNGLSWNYAHAMVKRMFQRERVEFCDPSQLRKLIAALTYHAQRKQAATGSGHER